MIDATSAEPVLIEKQGRGVIMVIAVDEYERANGSPGRRGNTVGQVTKATKKWRTKPSPRPKSTNF